MQVGNDTLKLEVRNLSLSWDGSLVCESVSFSLAGGEIACLVGRSGSGKTTIFHAVAGLTKPDVGSVLLDGEDVTGRPGKISYMLQKDLLLNEHTIVDNVSMPLRISGMRRREACQKAGELMPQFGIAGTEKLYPSQLSGGMRQRAALLRTYLTNNDVVLMDEPFSALDAFTRGEMRAWFLGMLTSLGMTSMIVTHDVDEAVVMADHVLVLAGNPAQGVPSTIKGVVDIDVARDDREQFALSDDALSIKRRILALLGS